MSPKLRTILPHGAALALSAVLLYIFTGLGCSTASLTDTWKDPEFKSPAMTSILVISNAKNPVNRRIWEDEIVAKLSIYRVAAVPSYRLFPDSIPNPDQMDAATREKNFEGVLFIRRLPSRVSTTYMPGYTKKVAVTRYDRRSKTYAMFIRDIEEPGYTDSSKVVRHEVNVFTTQDGGRLVWAGTGEMIDPSSRPEIRREITDLIAPELSRQGIIPVNK